MDQTCVDIDECSTGLDECKESAQCLNVAGSFNCKSTIIFTSTGDILTEDTVIGTGLTIPKAYEISIDLKIQPNPSDQFRNVFQFRVRVP